MTRVVLLGYVVGVVATLAALVDVGRYHRYAFTSAGLRRKDVVYRLLLGALLSWGAVVVVVLWFLGADRRQIRDLDRERYRVGLAR